MPHHFGHFHIHTFHLHYDEFSQVLASRTIQALAVSLVSIFIPIYLIELQDGQVNKAMGQIVLFFVGYFVIRLIFTPFFGRLVAKYGPKHLLALSTVPEITGMVLLAFLDHRPWLLVPITLMIGLSATIFFVGLHVDLSAAEIDQQKCRVSTTEISRKIAMALGPLIGGIIAGSIGIFYTFIASAILMLVSLTPLKLKLEPNRESKSPRWKNIKPFLFSSNVLSNFGIGISTGVSLSVWPLFIFILLDSYIEVGLIVSLSLIVAVVLMRIIGIRDTPKQGHRQLRSGMGSLSLVHGLRLFAGSPAVIGGVNVLNDLSFALLIVPFTTKYYHNARQSNDRLSYIVAMEMAFSAGSILLWATTYAVFLVTNQVKTALFAAFIMAALGVLATRNIEKLPSAGLVPA